MEFIEYLKQQEKNLLGCAGVEHDDLVPISVIEKYHKEWLVNSSSDIHNVSYYYLKDGEKIKEGDEWGNIDGDDRWRVTGQINKIYRSKMHYPHRRKL